MAPLCNDFFSSTGKRRGTVPRTGISKSLVKSLSVIILVSNNSLIKNTANAATNATAKPVEMLIGDNRNKKTSTPQSEQETQPSAEQPKPSQPKRQPFGGDSVEMIPNWLMNRYK